jgi:TRAP-type transport system small permease protein
MKAFSVVMQVIVVFNKRYHQLLIGLITLLMALIIIPVSLQILSRYTGIIPRYIWTEEVARFCFVWIIMIGAIIAVRDSSHFDVDLLPSPQSKRNQGIRNLIVHISIAAMGGIFVFYGIDFAKFGFIQSSEMSGINMATIYISFPLAGFSWLLFLTEKIAADIQLIRGNLKPIEK